jgi:uncharacterized membrane protein
VLNPLGIPFTASLLVLLGVLALLGLFTGAVFGWVSFLTLRRMRERVTRLEQALSTLGSDARDTRARPEPAIPAAAVSEPPPQPEPAVASGARLEYLPGPVVRAFARVREHWMVWLGGLCVGLAGVFLVRYSIEQGYLGPLARVLMGITVGMALHVLAEWLRRRMEGSYDAIAALAGGASLTLYAAVLAALHLYQLGSPAVTFALLALVSLATMALALRHGPVLAILGVLGAFAVPALLGGDAENLLPVLAYGLVVTMASFLLMRYVYRDWLWWGTMAGALFWWWVALRAGAHTEAWLGVYLGVVGWSLLALRWGNYRLAHAFPPGVVRTSWRHWLRADPGGQGLVRVGLLLLLLALAHSIAVDPQWSHGPLIWLPLPFVILLASRYNASLRAVPWLALLALAAGFVGSVVAWQPLAIPSWSLSPVMAEHQGSVLVTLALLAAVFSASGLWQLRARRDSGPAASLAFMAPLLAVALAYVLVPEAVSHWTLSAVSLAAGLVLGGFAGRRLRAGSEDAIAFWQIAAGHLAYSLAAVISFDQASLTLALAVQVLSLTWLTQRFGIHHLHWLVKLVLAVIVVRLTFNPWLAVYGQETHWTLWTYGGSLLLVFAADQWVAKRERLKLWLRAASVHLLLLFVHTSTRYWLYDGDVFATRYDFVEVALNTSLWAALALLYFWRGRQSPAFAVLYQNIASLLMLLAFLSYLVLLSVMNPLWAPESAAAVSATPIFNLLLLAYGLPVVLWLLASRYYEPDLCGFFALLAGVGLWLFVSLEVRHLWHGRLDLADAMRDGELYTYSVVWLLMAVGAMLRGTLRGHRGVYRGGLALLVLVILKIFFVDMGGLTGLLRALSFMGLGLSLLGLAFAHQYLARRAGAARTGDALATE